jgi:hypothetical protein
MDQLVKLVQERTGIDEAQARQAAETVVGFLKDRLPPQMAGQIDNVISGSGGGAGGLGGFDLGKLTGGG